MAEANIIRLVEKLPWNPSRPRWPQKRDLEKIDRVILHQSLGHAAPSWHQPVPLKPRQPQISPSTIVL